MSGDLAQRMREICAAEMEALGRYDPGRLSELMEEKRALLEQAAAGGASPEALRAARDVNRELLVTLRRGLREIEGVYRP